MTRDGLCGVDAYDVEVGLTVRHFRSTRRVSQAELASALGVSSQQVRSYERGEARMCAAVLVRAADRLKVRPEDLLPSAAVASTSQTGPHRTVHNGRESGGDKPSELKSPRHQQALLALLGALQP